MSIIPNRCSGCEHYNGQNSLTVICALKVRTSVDHGCSSFSPDDSAECYDCYYNEDPTKGYQVNCKKYGNFFSRGRSRCEGYAIRWEHNPPEKKKGCFVSTAVCELMNQSDDCYTLSTLRKFRDDILLPNPKTSLLVSDYYDRSEHLVEMLKIHPNRQKIAEELFHIRLKSIVCMIDRGKNEEAIRKYTEMIAYLESLRKEFIR